jgi:hypothetical protein
MAGEFVQRTVPPQKDCGEYPADWGQPSASYHFIWKGNKNESEYPPEACPPWYHATAQIDSLKVNTSIIGDATAVNLPASTITCTHVTASGTVHAATSFTGPTITALNAADAANAAAAAAAQATANSKKAFDIPHPTKKEHRLRHICLEGPEAGVYVRGRLTGQNVIELPEYWRGLVDPETITVTLTQIKTSQDLIIDGIEWGTRIKVRSGNGTDIDCFYYVQAERKDVEKNIPEYTGLTTADYPGDNREYRLNNN